MSNQIKLIDHLEMLQIDQDSFVMWNRFYPVLLKLNKAGVNFVKNFKDSAIKITDRNKSIIDMLMLYGILVECDSDPSKENFIKSIWDTFDSLKKNMERFYRDKASYAKLDFFTDRCNLGCSYCINEHKKIHSSSDPSVEAKKKLLDLVIDQYFSRILQNDITKTRIAFNGGEFLLEWPLMNTVVRSIADRYPQVKVEYALNTNMTLMTKEIAEFLSEHHFEVYMSIDGYKFSNDKARVFKDGKGTYDVIMKNLALYREYNKAYPIKGFQGTIDYIENFDPDEVYKMESHGFIETRLAPNLLEVTEEDAIQKARLMGIFLDKNMTHSFKVTEVYFDNMKKLINRDTYRFFFNCKGLGPSPDLHISFNLSTLEVGHLCAYIPLATISFEELGYDIYNPILWAHSSNFIQARLSALIDQCMECKLVAICRGGCIYSGLDKENKINKAACAYQNEIWKIYVEKIYKQRASRNTPVESK